MPKRWSACSAASALANEEAKTFCGIQTDQHDDVIVAAVEAISEELLEAPAMLTLWGNSVGEVPDRLKLAPMVRLAMLMRVNDIGAA
jgi:hypothetical protein